MPVKSLHSSVIVWPRRAEVLRALENWARRQAQERADVLRIGCFGSLARGKDWGVGSDADVVVIVDGSPLSPMMRSAQWDTSMLPVPTEVLVYTEKEWVNMKGTRFYDTVACEAIWVFNRANSKEEKATP